MIKTIGLYNNFVDELSNNINKELEARNITKDNLIDIKFEAKSGSGKYALIIYEEK
ncbi:MAG: hypothetical protein J6A25_07420 [Lachnospiraceae bacterium]|nr:hypothetical protein [Lachnospiraceae bacterium]